MDIGNTGTRIMLFLVLCLLVTISHILRPSVHGVDFLAHVPLISPLPASATQMVQNSACKAPYICFLLYNWMLLSIQSNALKINRYYFVKLDYV